MSAIRTREQRLHLWAAAKGLDPTVTVDAWLAHEVYAAMFEIAVHVDVVTARINRKLAQTRIDLIVSNQRRFLLARLELGLPVSVHDNQPLRLVVSNTADEL